MNSLKIIEYLIKGYTKQEISLIFHSSQRTINRKLEEQRDIHNCKTTYELIAKYQNAKNKNITFENYYC